jgi:hypothetical protein
MLKPRTKGDDIMHPGKGDGLSSAACHQNRKQNGKNLIEKVSSLTEAKVAALFYFTLGILAGRIAAEIADLHHVCLMWWRGVADGSIAAQYSSTAGTAAAGAGRAAAAACNSSTYLDSPSSPAG